MADLVKLNAVQLLLVLLVSGLFMHSPKGLAQGKGGDKEDSGDVELEALYDDYDRQEVDRVKKEQTERVKKSQSDKPITKLEDLVDLEPFNDIAVIQRKYLPKTHRFETGIGGMFGLNNAFFSNYGLSLRMSYYFTEKVGIELNYLYLSSSTRDVTDNLRNNQDINTKSIVTPDSFYGAAFKWVPIYGKMAFLNEIVVPFDTYFAPGFGMTQIKDGDSVPTLFLGTGQMFAVSKKMAFRWDFVWNIYSADVATGDKNSSTTTSKLQNDLFISAGVTFFFPEATYR
ncbi:MAG: outer membrane beta-barrel domain-containing protein [Bdellovibrionales bacterium]|nr:outer membrane beta-barrel domain-containing protein [Bdellovibrionales bacterium]